MKRIFSVVLLVLLASLSACAVFTKPGRDLSMAENLVRDRSYARAAAMYQNVIREHPGSRWETDARFGLASLLVSHDNPKRNYSRALRQFDLFLKLSPQDPRADEARNWRQVLKTIDQLKRLDIRHEKRRRKRR